MAESDFKTEFWYLREKLGKHRATLYKAHDGKEVRGTFTTLKDALSFIGSSDLKLMTVDYYEHGTTENGEPKQAKGLAHI